MTDFMASYGLVQYPGRVTKAFREAYPPLGTECEIPGCTYSGQGMLSSLVYDHCHTHGFIRGTIHGACNRNLGRYEANIPFLGRGNLSFDAYINRCPMCATEIYQESLLASLSDIIESQKPPPIALHKGTGGGLLRFNTKICGC